MTQTPKPIKPIRRSQPTEPNAEPAASKPIITQEVKKPIAEQAGEGWHVAVYYHPVVKARFSYQLTMDRRVRLNPSPVDDQHSNLFGCFGTPQEALEAAMEEVEDE